MAEVGEHDLAGGKNEQVSDVGGILERAGWRSDQCEAGTVPLEELPGGRIEAAGTREDEDVPTGLERRRSIGGSVRRGKVRAGRPFSGVGVVDGCMAGSASVGAGGKNGSIGTQHCWANFVRGGRGSPAGVPELLKRAAGAGPGSGRR